MERIKFFNSIKFKIVVVLLVTIIIPLIVFSKLNIYHQKKNYINTVEKNIESQINTLDNMLISYILNIQEHLDYLMEKIIQKDILKDISNIDESDIEYIQDNIDILSKKSSDIKHIYLALENGEMYIDKESKLQNSYDPRKRPFYINTVNNNKNTTLSNIYMWENELLLTLSKPIRYKNKVVGVLGIDINIDKINNLVVNINNDLQQTENVIIDEENIIVCNTIDISKVGVDISQIDTNIINKQNKKSFQEIYLDKNNYLFKYKESKINGWKILGLVKYESIQSQLNKIEFNGNILLIAIVMILSIIVLCVCKYIYMPLEYILDIIKKIKKGEYKINRIYNKHNEFGVIEDSLYRMAKEIKISHSTLENLAYKDLHLCINNKNKFFKEVNELCANKDQASTLILIDIKNLKLFNERFGYGKGDELLMKISHFLLSIVDEDCLFRYDGDEFAIILKNTETEKIDEIINKIHNRFNESWFVRDINYSTRVTIIIMQKQKNIEYNIDIILSNFEYVMKETKLKNLRTGYVYLENNVLKRKNKIKEILDKCIKQNNLMVYYQPINDITNNKYKKMEALIRLKDDKLGTISPFEFISIAEESGQIYDIGLYVLESVCKKIIDLDNENINLDQISINISAVQFMNENFTKDIVKTIEKYNINSNRLIFEITENIFIGSYTKILEIMNELSKLGIKFALDDFGTGYSSLSYILNLPIDIIKIDKSFIAKIESDHKSRDIINLISTMCKKLDLQVIVEGVETKKQLEILKDIGCTNIQGYYFSKPISGEEIISVLKKNHS